MYSNCWSQVLYFTQLAIYNNINKPTVIHCQSSGTHLAHKKTPLQLHLAMRADNTPAGLSVLAECTTDVRQWYLQNRLQLNLDKSEALIIGTTNQLRAVTSSVSSVVVA